MCLLSFPKTEGAAQCPQCTRRPLTTAAGGHHRVLLRQRADGQAGGRHGGLQGQARDGLDDDTGWARAVLGLKRAALRGQAGLPRQLLSKQVALLQRLLQNTRVDLQSNRDTRRGKSVLMCGSDHTEAQDATARVVPAA